MRHKAQPLSEVEQTSPPGVLHEFSAPFERADLGRLDMKALQFGYAQLGEKAAEAVMRNGLDLDDVIFEHWADVQGEAVAGPQPVRIEWLSDRQRCVDSIRRQCPSVQGPDQTAIVGLRVRVLSDPLFNPFRAGSAG